MRCQMRETPETWSWKSNSREDTGEGERTEGKVGAGRGVRDREKNKRRSREQTITDAVYVDIYAISFALRKFKALPFRRRWAQHIVMRACFAPLHIQQETRSSSLWH